MNILKKTLATALLLTATTTLINAGSPTFEQNGVKEGNDRLSLTLLTSIPDEGDEMITLQAQYGRFLSNDIELLAEGSTYIFGSDSTLYTIGAGANYYFAKTPLLTPYVGGQFYYYVMDVAGTSDSLSGGDIHLGTHYFLNENAAITPVAGAQFIDFTDYTQSYLNIYLTYFFD